MVMISSVVIRAAGRLSMDLAVAQHGYVIGELFDLVQPVRDVDDRYLFLAQPLDELEKLVDIGLLERLGRLVEKENLGLCERWRRRSR